MKIKILLILIIFAVILLPPILLRDKGAAPVIPPPGVQRLVIITPHSDSIKTETGNAFRKYYKEKYGEDIVLDFRAPGGTSDIIRFIADRYKIEFRDVCEKNGIPWTPEVAAGFSDPATDKNRNVDPNVKKARELFLKSDVGIGIDLMYGGGVFDLSRQAKRGFAVDAQIDPSYISADKMPSHFGGETIYDPAGRFYGLCLSTFGICVNTDRIAEMENKKNPVRWADLGDPRFFNKLAIADPSKSGSANKCFEVVVQQCMAEAEKTKGKTWQDGWTDGLNLIKRIVANAAVITDSAGKVTRDVASGNAAAGMAIDTYGLTEQEWNVRQFGAPHFLYITPKGGTAVSPDPVQMLRGAPNKKAARAFIEFMLSEGQKTFCFKAGVPGGPKEYALRRPPVLKELYKPEYKKFRSDPEYNPYDSGADFVYRPERTGKYYDLLRNLIRVLMLDCQEELQEAWAAIIKAGGPDKVPEAMKEFNALPFTYAEAGAAAKGLNAKNARDVVRMKREWRDEMRRHYKNAARLAAEGR